MKRIASLLCFWLLGMAIASAAPIRTVIYIYKETTPGQDIFIKGGHDAGLVPGSYPTMGEAITYNNTLNGTTAAIKANDSELDWGTESALDWTTNSWPAEWGPKNTYADNGFGEDPENQWGPHWWKFDVTMDGEVGDWFEFKAFIREGSNEFWESNINQADTPHTTINHWAKKGFITKVSYDSNTVEFIPLAQNPDERKVTDARARWVSRDKIGWILGSDAGNYNYTLHYDVNGNLIWDTDGKIKVGADFSTVDAGIALGSVGNFNNESGVFYEKFAFMRDHGFTKISVSVSDAQIEQMLLGQVVIAKRDSNGNVVDATSIQKAGVIDELYSYDGDLGLKFQNGIPSLSLWAPTAHSVRLMVYPDSTTSTMVGGSPFTMNKVMVNNKWTGAWTYSGASSWKNMFYLYEVTVFDRFSGTLQTYLATDPYSISLSMNSERSQMVDIENDTTLKPAGWDSHTITPQMDTIDGVQVQVNDVQAPEDIAIYELHVRDFSVLDTTVPEAYRGTFKAFAMENSTGRDHLEKLAQSGLTHIHLLPVNDIKSVNEDKNQRIDLTDNIEKLYPGHPQTGNTILQVMESYAADSEQQQAIATDLRAIDGYNWGYDPFHYMVPEGSYSSDPDGATRILEFREMVQALHGIGLRVVPDVVFNHLFDTDILQRVVPDYYHRLDHDGNFLSTSCCPDTASEHYMFARLMRDAIVHWAKTYKVDSFRFDLMGFHTEASMWGIRQGLDQLTEAQDGIDGSKIYLYGEGWQFGSLEWKLPAEAMHQYNAVASAMGLGTFNDRIRDSVKGKGQNPHDLFVDDAFITDKTQNRDQVLSGLRSTLNDWANGYVNDPQESINYVTAHDKATLWDHMIAKVGAFATADQMAKMHNLGVSMVALSQGVPFFHAGVEVLRSKSGDENSYNSGDWFNRLDYNYQTNNWKKGLPPGWQPENLEAWDDWRARLNSVPVANNVQIMAAFNHFQDMLKIRKSSPLFRMRTKGDIQSNLSLPGSIWNDQGNFDGRLIVLKLTDFGSQDLDPNREVVWVLFNASWDQWIHYWDTDVNRSGFKLHPVLQNTSSHYLKDLLDGCCTGAGRATAFVNQANSTISVPPQTVLVYTSN